MLTTIVFFGVTVAINHFEMFGGLPHAGAARRVKIPQTFVLG
jgi:hypothetical protein